MSRPAQKVTYARNENRPYDVEFHLVGCSCSHCRPVPPPLPVVKLTFAGIFVGNLIAFAWDPHGALAALAATIGVRI